MKLRGFRGLGKTGLWAGVEGGGVDTVRNADPDGLPSLGDLEDFKGSASPRRRKRLFIVDVESE